MWKWRNNVVLDPLPWTLDGAWQKLRHDHDELLQFSSGDLLDEHHFLINLRCRLHDHVGVLQEIRELMERPWRCSVHWTSRDSNASADFLARRGGFLSTIGVVELVVAPLELEHLLLKDRLAIR